MPNEWGPCHKIASHVPRGSFMEETFLLKEFEEPGRRKEDIPGSAGKILNCFKKCKTVTPSAFKGGQG